ncbi:V-type ATPase assembly factor PKR1 [Spathaspora sp. JA1]|nr:V-type ATPase assembly factor PKR1 [Spathaspora sp. JA1]
MAFLTELWDSVFTPGTSPALIKATHASFVLLLASLIWLIVLTKSIHFINLFVIAILLYATVIWFINELQQGKLKTNEELVAEESKPEEKEQEKEQSKEQVSSATSVPSAQNTPRRRKV